MWDETYKLAGMVHIPEEKKEGFNRLILKLLYMGGIRKTEEIELGGKNITVVTAPEPDRDGIVRFDYSIFEKRKRDINTYNMNTCELYTPDRGCGNFGLVMDIVMVMQEAYSEGSCYYMYRDKPINVEAYAILVRSLLGITLTFPGRSGMWDMLLFFHNTEEYKNITKEDVWNACPFKPDRFLKDQFLAAWVTDYKEIKIPQSLFEGERSEMREAPKWPLAYYIYTIMVQIMKDDEGRKLKTFLKVLLDAGLSKRKELAQADDKYGIIAESSLYLLPAVIAKVYALAIEKEFWDVWDSLGIRGYSDIISKEGMEESSQAERYSLPFYRAIERKNEDEFVEYWEDADMNFSEKMQTCFVNWKNEFDSMCPDEISETEPFLAQIIDDLQKDQYCRLVDKLFVMEFMAHQDDENYKKALLLYRKIMDADLKYFPELTRRQAVKWMIMNYRNEFDSTAVGAFQALLINHRHRFEILGF